MEISSNEDLFCPVEPGHFRAHFAGKGSKLRCCRFSFSQNVSPFFGKAKIDAPTDDPVFAFSFANQVIVVLLNVTNLARIKVHIDFGTKQELEMIGEPERLATIDSVTAKAIASQTGKFSLYSQKHSPSFIEIVTVNENRFKLPYDPELTVKDLKLLTLCFSLHRKLQSTSVFHLFFLGLELTNDFVKLSEIPRFAANSVIHVAHNRGNAPDARFYSRHEENIKNIEILLRNASECNKFSKKNINNRQRERFSEPPLDAEVNESFRTFGDLTERIGELMVSYSTQLNRLADVLDKDERMCPRSRKYQEAKFVIENTLDTARYTGPMMKNFSSVRVDITNNRFNSN